MIAIETSELLDRPACVSCDARLKRLRGCGRPDYRGGKAEVANRFTSPLLQDLVVRECPVGLVLRESPAVYDLLSYLILSENQTPLELSRMPGYYQHMLRVYQSETARVSDVKQKKERGKKDAAHGARVLKHG